MGIQDRDYYREEHRKDSLSGQGRRGSSTFRIALIWLLVGASVFAFIRLLQRFYPSPSIAPLFVPTAAKSNGRQEQQVSPPTQRAVSPLRAVPDQTTPSPPTSIYRCGSTYSNTPCAGGGRATDGAVASGFDSRPSEKLARLVDRGRSSESGNVSIVTTSSSNARPAICQSLNQQIEWIDRAARQPQSASDQDSLREDRRRARDRQAALRC